jgi:hypothetical protein
MPAGRRRDHPGAASCDHRSADTPGKHRNHPQRSAIADDGLQGGKGTAKAAEGEDMAANTGFVIVGAGQAGAKAAQTLREEGFDGPIVLFGEENQHPYERPPLSKGYLLGKEERETVYVHPPQWYIKHDIDLRLGATVTAIDPAGHEVTLADGSRIGYAKLLLTTGSSPRRLPVPGADLEVNLPLDRGHLETGT